MVEQLEELAKYYRNKGFEAIAQKTDVLASEARAAGMPNSFPKNAPRGSEEAKKYGRKEPKGSVFTPELAQQLKTKGRALDDDVDLLDLGVFDLKEANISPLIDWQREVGQLNRTQRATLRRSFDILWLHQHKTIGFIREASLEDLASVRLGAISFGMKRAKFFKEVFQVDEQRERT